MKMRTGLNGRVVGYNDGLYGDDGKSLDCVTQISKEVLYRDCRSSVA